MSRLLPTSTKTIFDAKVKEVEDWVMKIKTFNVDFKAKTYKNTLRKLTALSLGGEPETHWYKGLSLDASVPDNSD